MKACTFRRLVAELVGAFFLVFAAAGTDIVADLHPDQIPVAVRAIAPALVVGAFIYGVGAISGAHFNPAVTIAFAARRVFPVRWVVPYVLAQLTGAIAAAAVLHADLHPSGHSGANYPRGTDLQSYVMEVVLTTLLVLVILATATQHRLIGPQGALPSAAAIAAAGMIGIPVSGASLNPARSLGPAIVGDHWAHQWIYVAGPLSGAALAVLLTFLLRGARRADEHEAAQGDENR